MLDNLRIRPELRQGTANPRQIDRPGAVTGGLSGIWRQFRLGTAGAHVIQRGYWLEHYTVLGRVIWFKTIRSGVVQKRFLRGCWAKMLGAWDGMGAGLETRQAVWRGGFSWAAIKTAEIGFNLLLPFAGSTCQFPSTGLRPTPACGHRRAVAGLIGSTARTRVRHLPFRRGNGQHD